MELVVRKHDLLRELQLFQGIVERKNTIPILANVLLDAKDGEVKFLATDLDGGSILVRHVIHLPAEGVKSNHRLTPGCGEQNESQSQI